jgi:hypothetical protein
MLRAIGLQADAADGCVGDRSRCCGRGVIREIANQGIHGVEGGSMWFGHESEWVNGIRTM